MRYSSFIIVIALVSAVFMGFYGFANSLNEMSDVYDRDVEMATANSFNKLDDIANTTQEMIDTIKGDPTEAETGIGKAIGWLVDKTAFLALVPQALSMMLDIFTLPIDFLQDFVNLFIDGLGIDSDSWIITFFYAIIPILLIFTLVSLIMKWRT